MVSRQVVSGRWLREGLLEGGRAGVAQPLAHVHEHGAAEGREALEQQQGAPGLEELAPWLDGLPAREAE